MPRGRPRIRTPEYWVAYRRRRNQEKRMDHWRGKFARLKKERGCATCPRDVVMRQYAQEQGLDPDFGICETCDREDMIGQK